MLLETLRTPISSLMNIGRSLGDAQDIRLQKSLMVAGSLMFILAGAVWGIAYIFLGEPFAGMIPLSYAIVSSASVLHFSLTGQYRFFRTSQLLLILILPFLLMLALGGYIHSSAVIVWSYLSPLGALLFAEHRHAPRWQIAFLSLVILSGFLETFAPSGNNLSQGMVTAFFVLNLGTVSVITFILLHYFVGQKDHAYRLLHQEQDRSERLLLNVLPREIAARLKAGERTIADHHTSASILFADMVSFTPLTNELPPGVMVELLNEIYSHFDTLIEQYGAEKIRTIGDNYLIAAGLPRPRDDHAQALARLALAMNAYIATLPSVGGRRLNFRFGINSGPVIAGVIGHKKFAYDVWGDTVNTASRMESQGEPGKIQITQATYERIKDEFACEPNGPVIVKGKGEMETWFLVGAKESVINPL
jgi:guanylate cyclase